MTPGRGPRTRQDAWTELQAAIERARQLVQSQRETLEGSGVSQSSSTSSTSGISVKKVDKAVWRLFVIAAMEQNREAGELLTEVITDYLKRRKEQDNA